jgi:hypothetical protein
LLAYGTVFEFAALAMLIGGVLALLLLRPSAGQSGAPKHHVAVEM